MPEHMRAERAGAQHARRAITQRIACQVLCVVVLLTPAVRVSAAQSLPFFNESTQDRDGTRWINAPYLMDDIGRLFADETVLCNAVPGEQGGANPSDCYLNEAKDVTPEAKEWYKQNFSSLLYFGPPQQAQGGTGTVGGVAATRASGQVLPAETASTGNNSNQDYLGDIVWNGDGQHGNFQNAALLSGALLAEVRSNIREADFLSSHGNSFLPLVGPTGIVYPGSSLFAALSQLIFGGRRELDVGQRPAAEDAYFEAPQEDLAKTRQNPGADRDAKAPCADGTCDSQGNVFAAQALLGECSGGSCSGVSGLLGSGGFGNAFSGLFRNMLARVQGLLSRFGSADVRALLGRFNLGALTGLTDRFGQSRLNGLFSQNGFTSGSDRPRLSGRPPLTVVAPSPECSEPTLTTTEVGDVADVLGLPRDAGPWRAQFQDVATLPPIVGVNAETGAPVTVNAESFSGDDRCVWIVQAGGEVVIASDQRQGGEIRILLP